MGFDFIAVSPKFEEKDEHLTPKELALHNAIGKAREISKKYKKDIVIGVDTVVSYKDHQINKPKNKDDAKKILKMLSGKTHKVTSAVCVIDGERKKEFSATEKTLVKMARISEEEIENYIKSGEGKDKAGGYAIQGRAALFIKGIEGDYFNVVGLPLFLLGRLLNGDRYNF